jgi:hypothetical protein
MVINLRKAICPFLKMGSRLYKAIDCRRYEIELSVCTSSGKLPSPWCPELVKRIYRRGKEPKTICALHPEPPPPPYPKYPACAETGLAASPWCPIIEVEKEPALGCRRHRPPRPAGQAATMIIFIVDIANRTDLTWKELLELGLLLGRAGVEYVRIFPGWAATDKLIQPFIRPGGPETPADCTLIDPEYLRLLQRFQKAMAMGGIGLIYDLLPAQLSRRDYAWAWWADDNRNLQSLDGIYDIRPHAMDYWRWWASKVFEMIGKEGNLAAFGNELQGPGDYGPDNVDLVTLKEWARRWAIPLGTHLRDTLGLDPPIFCPGEPYAGTGHKIQNRLIEEAGWPEKHLQVQLHGLNLWEPFNLWYKPGTAERKYSTRKFYCISDDGSEFGPDNQIPDQKKGICSLRLDGSIRCSANQQWRIDTACRIEEVPDFNLAGIEWMPQEFKGASTWRPGDLGQGISVDVYWKAALDLWGIDIRRAI